MKRIEQEKHAQTVFFTNENANLNYETFTF